MFALPKNTLLNKATVLMKTIPMRVLLNKVRKCWSLKITTYVEFDLSLTRV